jgi:two-component system chemotaxis sensor kinase CheA
MPATSEKPPQAEEGGHSSERILRQSIRVDADKIDYLMNEVGELVVSRAYFFQLFNDMRLLQQEFKETLGLDQRELKPLRELTFRLGEASVALGRVSNELQEGVMKVRMLPVSQLFNRYPRLVRDLVHHTDKKVRLEVRGEETELDKMIIEEISDPLIHLIRNAVDHGIEPAAERQATGKSPEGHLLLEAYHESNHIVIEISDDGRGVNPAKIRQKALEKGLYSAEELERMTDNELFQIIMLPGFSTASVATKTSGRGVGMDVVKKNIEKLNGTFEVESETGTGTMMRIKIPLTLAIIQALMVRVGQDLFTIPLPAVEETLKISKDEVTTIEGVEVIHIRETTMPIFRLQTLFAMDGQNEVGNESFVVIVNAGNQHVGLVVDELMGQDEVVIKPIADYLREESGFSGATIIGDGKVSLILDVHDLVKLAAKRNTLRRRNLQTFGRMRVAEAQHG